MQASPQNIDMLFELQEAHRTALQSHAQLDGLPHKDELAKVRTKRAEVQGKLAQIKDMHSDAIMALEQLEADDASLAAKQSDLQGKIDSAQGDYRNVGALTNELANTAKRRETVAKKRSDLQQKIAQIDAVSKQATDARDALDKQEASIIQSYKQQGGNLQKNIMQAEKDVENLSQNLPDDLVDLYFKTAKHCGGIGLARLEQEGTCSACRNAIEPSKMLQLKTQAPLVTCPNCKRLLVIE